MFIIWTGVVMKSKRTVLFITVSLVVIVAVAVTAFIGHWVVWRERIVPFKCTFFTHYDFGKNQSDLTFSVTQDMRFYSKESGYVIFNGKVTINGETKKLNRSLLLSDGVFLQGKTISYHIKDMKKSMLDDTPDNVFKMLLGEYTFNPETFQIDIFPLDKKSYIVGGPYSFISSCIRY